MAEARPPMKRMLKLTVRARTGDQFEGRNLADSLLDLYRKHGIGGATVSQGVKGYGLRGAAKIDVLGNLDIVADAARDLTITFLVISKKLETQRRLDIKKGAMR